MEDKIDCLINMLKEVGTECSYSKLCEFNDQERKEYNRLLETFKNINSSDSTTEEKGRVLEELASYTIETAHIFEIYKNIRTNTNELDQLVKIKDSNRVLIGVKIIDERLINFIGECKNYQIKIPVTYVGKVCSLLSTTQNKICILFSYKGVTGKRWEESEGLIKKFYLSKEKAEERFCIIDFNIKDFEEIAKGNNFLQIIENKIMALKNDTDYSNLIQEHELESQILAEQQKKEVI